MRYKLFSFETKKIVLTGNDIYRLFYQIGNEMNHSNQSAIIDAV
jgi:hypothetical protein